MTVNRRRPAPYRESGDGFAIRAAHVQNMPCGGIVRQNQIGGGVQDGLFEQFPMQPAVKPAGLTAANIGYFVLGAARPAAHDKAAQAR